jgi:glyoxylase-like metal-dependent hydrolase (beta-lactamase superfamily II)
LTDKPVSAIVITHWHGDHALGVARLLREWPQARVISTQATRDMLASPDADKFMPGDNAAANAVYLANIEDGVNYLREAAKDETLQEDDHAGFGQAALEYAQFGREMARSRRIAPAEVFDQSLLLADETHPVEVKFFGRANTAGDAVVWLPEQKIVFSGDIVVLPVPYGFNSYPGEWTGVLADIRGLAYDVLVPGHGRPLRDTVHIDRLITMLEDIRAQVAALASTDMDAAAVTAAVNLESASHAIAGDDPWLNRWFRDYWKDPIVSSALREARGEPIVQGSN